LSLKCDILVSSLCFSQMGQLLCRYDEAELTQLEKDIKKLQGRQVVVVEEDY
jgi:hypothetical protein